jgi:hypothetical protein
MLHGGFHQFVLGVGAKSDAALHVAWAFAAIDVLACHGILLA